VFLDIRMPGLTGVQAAREILHMEVGDDEWLPEIVFITAYDQYAVQAFEQGAVDYVLKPAEPARLATTVQRLAARLAARQPAPSGEADDLASAGFAQLQPLLRQLATQGGLHSAPGQGAYSQGAATLEFLQAAVGSTVHLIPVREVLFFVSDEKYTRVQTATTEALIRKPIKELAAELDARQFWQIHRSTIVNLQAVQSVVRDERGRQIVSVKGHPQKLEVSRSFSGLFKGM
jgi:DNA-binding LytR/AlgR family response regulator